MCEGAVYREGGEKNRTPIWNSWNWNLKLEKDDEDGGEAFITDQWLFERGSPGRCIRGAQREAVLK